MWSLRGLMPLNLDLTSGNDAIKYRMVGLLSPHSWLCPLQCQCNGRNRKNLDSERTKRLRPRPKTDNNSRGPYKRAELWQRWWPIIRPRLGIVKKIANSWKKSRQSAPTMHLLLLVQTYSLCGQCYAYLCSRKIGLVSIVTNLLFGITRHYHNASRRFITSRERKKQQVLWVGPGFWPLYGFHWRFNGLWLWNTTP